MSKSINEELEDMKYLLGYQRGKVISEQTIPTNIAGLKTVQDTLKALGYTEVGETDGKIGPKTLGALTKALTDLKGLKEKPATTTPPPAAGTTPAAGGGAGQGGTTPTGGAGQGGTAPVGGGAAQGVTTPAAGAAAQGVTPPAATDDVTKQLIAQFQRLNVTPEKIKEYTDNFNTMSPEGKVQILNMFKTMTPQGVKAATPSSEDLSQENIDANVVKPGSLGQGTQVTADEFLGNENPVQPTKTGPTTRPELRQARRDLRQQFRTNR